MQQTIEDIKKLIKKDYEQKIKTFQKITMEYHDVFIGDSMISFFNLGHYGFNHAFNMGIPGDTTLGVLKRIHLLEPLNPKRVFLSVGSNDLVLTNHDIDTIFHQIITMKKTIDTFAKCYVLLITPVNPDDTKANHAYIAGRRNEDIIAINEGIKQHLLTDVIDVYTPLIDDKKRLNVIYSKDGIHINYEGYERYASVILEHIKASSEV